MIYISIPTPKKYRVKITRLQLENFRNYTSYEFLFPKEKDFIILIGDNGKGKTNFLESLYILSLGRSFRTMENEYMINWGEKHFRCKAELFYDEEQTEVEVFYSKAPTKIKNFKKNSVSLKNSEYVGTMLTVLFHPEDLNMLYLSPSFRRKYIDILLSQVDKKYLFDLSKYKKIIKQRNSLLFLLRDKKFKGESIETLLEDLDVWDIKLAEHGHRLIKKRIELVEFFNNKIEEKYKTISGKEERCEIKYKSKLSGTEEDYMNQIKERRFLDIRNAKTGIGPHLDDLILYINNKEILKSASRGEFRTILLAMKLVEIDFIKERTGFLPILLLDDVFSELDKNRQKHLFSAIEGCQTIITTTNAYDLSEIAQEKANIEFVNMG